MKNQPLKSISPNNPKRKLKLYKNKKFIATTIAITTIISGAVVLHHTRVKNQKINSNSNYIIGYDDLNLLTNKLTNKVTKDNFVILNMKDHDSMTILWQQLKLEYCQKNNIDIGILITSDATTLADVYLDLEYTMGLLETYPISYPVYLDVDSFFNNEKLSPSGALQLINAFLEKAVWNHIYVGVYGRQENLENHFAKYDKIAIDSDESGIIQKKQDKYYTTINLQEIIEEKDLNHSNCLKEDEYYIVKKEDSLKQIAKIYNISVEDLKKYNKIYWNHLKEGQVLRIPSQTQNLNNHLIPLSKPTTTGIDVSLWQGNVAWEQVDTDFAIIQIRDFLNEENDPKFIDNVNGCRANNIPYGCYAFSRAETLEGVKVEAQYIVEQLKGLNPTYPIYLDLETSFWESINEAGELTQKNYSAIETADFTKEFIKIWETEIFKAGYIPGIYCNGSLYQKLNQVTNNYLDNVAIWVAGSEYYDTEMNYDEKNNLPELLQQENIAMIQFSQKGKVTGITQDTDLNYCYLDYETASYHWDRMKFPTINEELIFNGIIFGSGLLVGNVINKKRLKQKERKRKKIQ